MKKQKIIKLYVSSKNNIIFVNIKTPGGTMNYKII